MDSIEGYKHFLSSLNDDRMNDMRLITRHITYAIALGTGQTWIEKYNDIVDTSQSLALFNGFEHS